ncbi:hypothetical protein CLU79DRAFT_839738 [Phycomyces nitens]|nr:hypothetical protein CLU79DRAFT_839738 [Phycomyces nitens]
MSQTNNTLQRLGSLEDSVKDLSNRMDTCETKVSQLEAKFSGMNVGDSNVLLYPTPKRLNGRDTRLETIREIIQKENRLSYSQADAMLKEFGPVAHELLRNYIQKIRSSRARIPVRWIDVGDDDKEKIFHIIEEGGKEQNIPLYLCEKSWGARCLAQQRWGKARTEVYSDSGNSK